MSTPRTVEVEITSKCNLRCKYCSHFSSDGDVLLELPTTAWLTFFKECGSLGVMNVIFSGGEPFCRPDICELVAGVAENRMRFSINSNGSLISHEIARFIASTKRCNSIQISIDGHCQTVHDSFRGTGSFEKALIGLKNLRNSDVPVVVRVTIHQQNIDYLPDIAEFILDKLQLPGFSTNAAMSLGLMRRHQDEVQLNAEQYSYAMQTLLDLNVKYNNRINAMAGPLSDATHWPIMFGAYKRKTESFDGCGTLNSCGCAMNTIAVRADGVIVPCHQIDGYALGLINRDKLQDIWVGSEMLAAYRKRNTIPLSTFPKCRQCEFAIFCRGGCPATIYALEKSAFLPSTIDCLKTFLANDGKLPIRSKLDS